ncbi:MAG: tRNA uridine-5-carboxymethylaminomethyl(34) synthesis GTPase MnmE [Alphaproteobacteria bacterium]
MFTDTIFAPLTTMAASAIGVVRISGKNCATIITQLTGKALPTPRMAVLRQLINPKDGTQIDEALLLWFPAPHSFTGEDVAELHVHGGRAVMRLLLDVLAHFPNTRPAEAGEFSRRAFHYGKMDLTKAEAIADLVAAETALQHRQALRQMNGELAKRYENWAEKLVKNLAWLEAFLDFPDEGLPDDLFTKVQAPLPPLLSEMNAHLSDNRRGELIREGIQVAVIGAPNAGKSSLVNAIAERDAVIVSAIAGTTRDVVAVHLDLRGYPVTLCDTAGLRESNDLIEQEGIKRARKTAEHADIKLAIFDTAGWPDLDADTLALVDERTIPVLNKIDLIYYPIEEIKGQRAYPVSASYGQGIGGLLDAIAAKVEKETGYQQQLSLTRPRHRLALEETMTHLQRALIADQAECLAEDLRLAVRSLGRITGRVDVEDLLDIIFKDFCIGK